MRNGAEVNAQDGEKETPIMSALLNGKSMEKTKSN